jgi:hypothetical protein
MITWFRNLYWRLVDARIERILRNHQVQAPILLIATPPPPQERRPVPASAHFEEVIMTISADKNRVRFQIELPDGSHTYIVLEPKYARKAIELIKATLYEIEAMKD